jgi:hypothetical protein
MIALNTHQLLAEVDSMPIDLKTKLIEKLLNRSATSRCRSVVETRDRFPRRIHRKRL